MNSMWSVISDSKTKYSHKHNMKIAYFKKLPNSILKLYCKTTGKEMSNISYNATFKYVGFKPNEGPAYESLVKSSSLYDSLYLKSSIRSPELDKDSNPLFNKKGNVIYEERQVDTGLVCDLVKDAFLDFYDIAILCTNDSDFYPAVALVQNIVGKKVILLGPRDAFNKLLRAICFGNLFLDEIVNVIKKYNS